MRGMCWDGSFYARKGPLEGEEEQFVVGGGVDNGGKFALGEGICARMLEWGLYNR